VPGADVGAGADVVVRLEAVGHGNVAHAERLDCRADVELAPAAERVARAGALEAAIVGGGRVRVPLEQRRHLVRLERGPEPEENRGCGGSLRRREGGPRSVAVGLRAAARVALLVAGRALGGQVAW